MSTKLICVLLLYFTVLACLSQPGSESQKNSLRPKSEIGNLYHRNYSTKEYNAAFQNWGGLQDQHGVMFFANNDGVLTYDGKRWSLTATPAQSNIRSMAMNKEGKVFVGALDDFGYLDRQKNGSPIYVSLLDKVKPELRGMGNIWQTHVYNNLVYFETETGLFCWNGERFQFYPWPNPDAYHMTFLWRESLYMQEEGLGLMVLKGDKFLPAPNGEFFKTTRIYNAFSLNNKVQLATRYDGIFLYDGKNVRKFQTQADDFFKENQIYSGLLLPDSSSVYGTRLGGAVIIDQKGLIRYLINNQNGLPTNIVLGVTLDSEGNIWFSLDNGISKFEINNALSFYNTNSGLEGAINSFCRYNGRLYVSTNTGVYFLRPASLPDNHASFEKIPDINMSTWQLLKFDDRMLVCSHQGFFELVGNDLRKVTDHSSFSIHRYKADSNRILLAIGNNQLQSLKLHKGHWQEAGYVEDVNLDNISFTETHAGKVWLCTFSQGAALLSFPEQNGSINYDKPTIKFLNQKNGLPEGSVKVSVIGGEVIFQATSEARIFRFDYGQNQFAEDLEFIKGFGLEDEGIFPITDEDLSGNFFFRTTPSAGTKQELILVKRSAAAFQHLRFDISRIVEHVHVNSFHENNIMWFGGADGIVRYEMNESAEPGSTFNTHLNKVLLNGDSTFFLGIGNIAQNLTFPYRSNAFRFEFTSTNFKAEELNEFQYKLEGHDDDWSEWTTENIKEYSRLWEGDYKFLVRSRNYAQQIGTTDEFNFSVAPPWFRSLYAYVIYVLVAGSLVWALVRWRSRNLLREKEALQKEIAHQTQEIRQQNIQLAEQSEELMINAEQLKALDKMESNFFVNISHEFRTPLSLILGPLEKSIREKGSGQIRLTELERMHRNAKRLQQLINQLLDLAKLESGGVKLNLQKSDFIYFIRVLSSSFESVAESRNIQFDVEISADSYYTTFDHEKVETVFYNLLSNAFKFTPDGGRISLHVTFDKGAALPISVSISDTGPGIPVDALDKIFDRFYQVDSSSAREFEGSGIGLSLVKELIQLMNCQIEVQSTVGSGTTFIVQLPLESVERESIPKHEIPDVEMGSRVVLQGGDDARVLLQDFVGSPESLVLLVEDNADLRSYLRENLENTYRIEVAENGLIGFEKALELIPDLILSDMMMPLMDGFTLCTKIRQDERTSHIPFVLLTARNTIESKLEGLELGADEYMTKPFNVREIQVRIKNLLEQRRNLRKGFSREVTIQPKNISITSVDEKFLNHVLEIMEAHLADPQFSVERFADEIGMSRKNLLRKIQALTDQSVNEFIRNFRLQRAAQLISGKTASISEIAYQVGFNNLSYFSKCFKDLFGVLPNEFEKVRGSRSEVRS